MSYSIANAKDDLEGILHGTTTAKVTNITSVMNRGGRNVIARLNPDELKRRNQLELYDGVLDYSAPVDLNEKRLADVQIQVNRDVSDNFTLKDTEEFDLRRADNWISVENLDGTKFFRVSKEFTPRKTIVESFGATTGWSENDDLENITLDQVTYAEAGAALRFDLDGVGTTGYMEKTLTRAVDLSAVDEIADGFVWIYLPNSASDISTVTLRWGNDSSNYWSVQGSTQRGSAKQGWNLYKFDWSSATETGTVAPASIDYLRFSFTYGGTAVAGIRIDSLFFSVPHMLDVIYFSKYLFTDSTGATWKEKTNADEDLVQLDTAAQNIYLFECARAAAQQLQGEDARADEKYFTEELFGERGNPDRPGLYAEYKFNNPNQAMVRRNSYYRP